MADETDLIGDDKTPLTKAVISTELQRMGLGDGDLVLMHTSLSRLGWIVGGAQTLLEAVMDVLGQNGTLVTPGFSSHLSDPTDWSRPSVPAAWVPIIRDNMPLFDPAKTPTRSMGRAVEAFRTWPGTKRSYHPCDSFLANGPLAETLLADYPLGNSFGQPSPLGRLHDHHAKILMLGAGYGSCTSFHLAEDGLPDAPFEIEQYPMTRVDGVTQWQNATQPQTYEEHFAELGADFEKTSTDVNTGFDGNARLFDMRPAVSFAREWLAKSTKNGTLDT